MATTNGSGSVNNQGAFVYTWSAIPNGNTGNLVDVTAFRGSNVTVEVAGTFGSGGNVKLEGSNDGTNIVTLNDINGNAQSAITANKVVSIQPGVRYVRPNVSAGDGTTAITVTLVAYPD